MDEPKKQPKEIEQPAEPTSPELPETALKQVAGGATTQAESDDQQDYYKSYLKEQ
jgi:hypothetical protein